MSEHVVGSIVEGKVIKIAPFGAIIAIDGGGQGLVHISQVANSFVQDINEHLKVDDPVKVKVMSVDPETRRISLSIRAALPAPEKPKFQKTNSFKPRESKNDGERSHYSNPRSNHHAQDTAPRTELSDFEEKMKDYLKQSNDKMASINKRANKR